MDPHIFADLDPDPGSQNLADPTDPDPKHWKKLLRFQKGLRSRFLSVQFMRVGQ